MVKLSTRPSSHSSDLILCYYINSTSQLQVIRIHELLHNYSERVVFPGERFLFEATLEAWLEICTGTNSNSVPSERIPCLNLRVSETSRDTPVAISDIDEGDL
jgi:hypothetical protein